MESILRDLTSQQKFYEKIQGREVINGRVFDADTFGSNGLLVTEKFCQQGLLHILLLANKVYPKLVKLFYANLCLAVNDIDNFITHNSYESYIHENDLNSYESYHALMILLSQFLRNGKL